MLAGSTASGSALRSTLRSSSRYSEVDTRRSSSRALTWDTDQTDDATRASRPPSQVDVDVEVEADPVPPPQTLRDVVDRELKELRNSDTTAPFYNPDWD